MIFYVSRDIERAVGIDMERYPDFNFVNNNSPLAELIEKRYPNRVLLNRAGELSSLELLDFFAGEIEKVDGNPRIMVFKNSLQIDRFCRERKWELLNPNAELVDKLERKISQYEWFKKIKSFPLPPSKVGEIGKLKFDSLVRKFGMPFILQYNTGHTGSGTYFISSSEEWNREVEKHPKREGRVSKYVEGEIYTLNACVTPSEILIGAISLQVTGIPELTSNKLSTVGNDWGYAGDHLSKVEVEKIHSITDLIGERMRKDGWRGLFGIDVVRDAKSKDFYVIEINARQPASVSFETQLRHRAGENGPMDWHIAALLDNKGAGLYEPYTLGASQIFLRKNSGRFANRFVGLTKVGEYNNKLDLVEEKPLFGLRDEGNIFIIPRSREQYEPNEEFLRLQVNFSLVGKMFEE